MEIALIALSIVSLSFMISYMAVLKKLKAVNEGFASLFVAYNSMRDMAESQSMFQSSTSDQDIHKENFIKFLSDSRDWAYQYIEDVQGGIKKFMDEVQPQLDHYNKYGIVLEGMIEPHDFALKKISKEVEELKKFLPQEPNDRR
jgi:uncharacterized protein YdcH (DUF465 family)